MKRNVHGAKRQSLQRPEAANRCPNDERHSELQFRYDAQVYIPARWAVKLSTMWCHNREIHHHPYIPVPSIY